MTGRWDATCWTAANRGLAQEVFKQAKIESRYVRTRVFGPANVLMRSIDRQHLRIAPDGSIPADCVLDALKVRDEGGDGNRFTGVLPERWGYPRVDPQRGGFYCSLDRGAVASELLHYAAPSGLGQPGLAAQRPAAFENRAYLSVRPIGTLEVAALDGECSGLEELLTRLEASKPIREALLGLRPPRSLFKALLDESDYAVARGIGVGLAANLEVEGFAVPSARDFETLAGGREVKRTGSNVVLLGRQGSSMTGRVRAEAFHLVDRVSQGREWRLRRWLVGPDGRARPEHDAIIGR
ncbi:MAG: hypothetical protein LW768_00480 [Rubrivivax sp.]|nr:hypothetical protein [Rubrivivax sp.]